MESQLEEGRKEKSGEKVDKPILFAVASKIGFLLLYCKNP